MQTSAKNFGLAVGP